MDVANLAKELAQPLVALASQLAKQQPLARQVGSRTAEFACSRQNSPSTWVLSMLVFITLSASVIEAAWGELVLLFWVSDSANSGAQTLLSAIFFPSYLSGTCAVTSKCYWRFFEVINDKYHKSNATQKRTGRLCALQYIFLLVES